MVRMLESSEVSLQLSRVKTLNPTSDESVNIIRTILPRSQQLTGKESQTFIDILDKIMPAIRADEVLYRRCLLALRKICGIRGIAPTSHVLSQGLFKSTQYPSASGGSADVWQGRYENKKVAIKVLRSYVTFDFVRARKSFYKEMVIWRQLAHPNIVPFLGISYAYPPISIVSEWMSYGTVLEYVRSHPNTSRPRFLLDISKGLQCLHSLNFSHGDLKGLNILINNERRACLTDFGLTSVISGLSTANVSTLASNARGTCRWMAPELLSPENDGIYNCEPSTASDIYSFAMVAIELFSGQLPFHEFRQSSTVILKVINGERPRRPEGSLELGLSDVIWNLVEMCWEHDRDKRPQISFVINYLRAYAPKISLAERLTDFDPNSKTSIGIVRSILYFMMNKVFAVDVTIEGQLRFLEVLDQAIESPHADDSLRRICISMLERIYSREGILPSSYQISGKLTRLHDKPIVLGSYADIWEGKCHGHQGTVAIKTFRASRSDKSETIRKRVFEQVATWKRLSHSNLVSFLGISNKFPPYIISEWMGRGNLSEYVLSNPGVDRIRLLTEVSRGLQYLHSRKIVHGDLNSSHVLVNDAEQACLTGFRLTSMINDGISIAFMAAPHASYRWMAPELFNSKTAGLLKNRFSEASDIYAFAMVFMEIFTGQVPFCELPTDVEVALATMRGIRPERPKEGLKIGLTDDIWDLMQTCWKANPTRRPEISSVLEHLQSPVPEVSRLEVLKQSDPTSCIRYFNILRSVLDSSTDMGSLLACNDQDALLFINVLDKAIGSSYSDAALDRKSLRMLLKLWDRTRVLPSYYLLQGGVQKSKEVAAQHSHADIWKGTHAGNTVTIRIYKSSHPHAAQMFLHEAVIRRRLSHPNILPFLGIYSSPLSVVTPWTTHGNLRQYLRTNPNANRLPLVIDIARGLGYLHSHSIVHGDLTGYTIRVTDDERACLADFGSSVIYDPDAQPDDVSSYVNRTAIPWTAPELLISKGATFDARTRSTASDIYAFAITVVVQIYSGHWSPMQFSNEEAICCIVRSMRPERTDQALKLGLSDDIWRLVQACWDQNPNERPKASFVLDQLEKFNYIPRPERQLQLDLRGRRKANYYHDVVVNPILLSNLSSSLQ